MNDIIDFRTSAPVMAAEKEKTENAIRYRTAVSVIESLLKSKEITVAEFEKMRVHLARIFNQIIINTDCVGT